MVDINVIGIETKDAGQIFEGSEEDIIHYMKRVGYRKTASVGHDTFFIKV